MVTLATGSQMCEYRFEALFIVRGRACSAFIIQHLTMLTWMMMGFVMAAE